MKFTLLAVSAFLFASMVSAAPSTVCAGKHVATKSETCASIAKHYKISVKEFQQWNTGLGSNAKKCGKITSGKSYCVKRGPKKVTKTTQKAATKTAKTGSASTNGLHLASHTDPNCKKYYTVLANDGCESVAKKNGITQAQLFKYNTGLHHVGEHLCDNLDTGRAYCVAV
ncbi:hypothetical protein CLU79DRAFT_839304 [Phycomyces nitens]|nr:hypothetical protein CLU79DRAFT_839304 [Phycomyces nitens]